MLRGQVSLELVLVIIVAVTAVSVVGFLAQNSVDSQRAILVQSQAIVLAQTVAVNLTGLLQLQETKAGTEIRIPTQAITVFNPTFREKCAIRITRSNPPRVSVEFDWQGDGVYDIHDIIITKPTRIPDVFGVPNEDIPCGEPIVVRR